jgi:cytochrome b6-f complex iron-sulfur subunit
MADKQADLSPEEKEKRLAELKAKMQASAQKAKAAAAESAPAEAPKPAASAPKPAAVATAQAVAETPAPVVAAEPVAEAPSTPTNGAAAAAAVAPTQPFVAPEPVFVEDTPEQKARKQMNRREFLTYAWGGALGLLVLETAVSMYGFMYPRFKAGEFGGKFFIPETSLPPTDAPPQAETAGKFWLVNTTDEGAKALYMVCTHLGCLYKWAPSNNRFECPCHGSKFSREGFYIEGPAPRSLDTFPVTTEAGQLVIDTGKKVIGQPATESPARVVPA